MDFINNNNVPTTIKINPNNDFFDNEFPYNVQHCKYFCIKEREISDWKKSSDLRTNRSKIIYFNKIS